MIENNVIRIEEIESDKIIIENENKELVIEAVKSKEEKYVDLVNEMKKANLDNEVETAEKFFKYCHERMVGEMSIKILPGFKQDGESVTVPILVWNGKEKAAKLGEITLTVYNESGDEIEQIKFAGQTVVSSGAMILENIIGNTDKKYDENLNLKLGF